MTEVFKRSGSALAARLVLLALADSAHDDGVTWIGQDVLAAKAKITEPSVRRCIRDLEASGEVQTRKAQRGRKRINVYRVTLPGIEDPDYSKLPFEVDPPFVTTDDIARSSSADDRAYTHADDRTPSCARDADPEEEQPSEGHDPHTPPAVIVDPGNLDPGNRPATVDRRKVTDAEYDLAAAILAEFNARAGSRYDASDWIAKIVMRIRERPQLTLDAHRVVIERAFENRWWPGAASPSVIYGNAGLFERTMHSAVALQPDGGALTSEEIRGYLTEWGPGTPYATPAEARAAAPAADVTLADDQVRED